MTEYDPYKTYHYGDFLEICYIRETAELAKKGWFGYSVRPDGVWLMDIENDPLHSTTEVIRCYKIFEGHDGSRPVLSFPCSRSELHDFLEKTSLDCMPAPDSEIYFLRFSNDVFKRIRQNDYISVEDAMLLCHLLNGDLQIEKKEGNSEPIRADPTVWRRIVSAIRNEELPLSERRSSFPGPGKLPWSLCKLISKVIFGQWVRNEKIVHNHQGMEVLVKLNMLQPPKTKTAPPKSSGIRHEIRKQDTQELHKMWQKAYLKLKIKYPNKNDSWYARQIAKMDITQGRTSETIRKNMKKY